MLTFSENRIAELRTERGLSQRELAHLTEIKQANISRWENGVTVPNVLDCWKLADFFGVTVDYLIGKSND